MFGSTIGMIFEMLTLILVFGIVLFLAYIITKKMAVLKQGASYNKNLQIVEVLSLAPGQHLYIVKIGEEYHLMSGTKERLNYCIPLDKEKLCLEQPEQKPFEHYMRELTKDLGKGKREKKDENEKK
ncbi:MAG: flagellar biosynthetic protein FliO [Cellulosilyticaceae bacterium]